jgi:hypothetical protein
MRRRREPIEPHTASKSYRVVSVSLYADQSDFVDSTAETLLRAGFSKANRSFVVQTALECLRNELDGKNPIETVTSVLQHQGRRPLSPAAGRIGLQVKQSRASGSRGS